MAGALNLLQLHLVGISVDIRLYHPESHYLLVESAKTLFLPRPQAAYLPAPFPDDLPSLPDLARQPGLQRYPLPLPPRPKTLLLHAPPLPHALLLPARAHRPSPYCPPHVHPLPRPTLAQWAGGPATRQRAAPSEIFLAATAKVSVQVHRVCHGGHMCDMPADVHMR